MRILTISNCPLERTQGSGYVVLGYADGLRALGWEVVALGPEQVALWPRARRARSWRVALGMLLHAWRRLRAEPFDVVEFYGGESWLAIGVLARRRRRRWLLVSHSNGLETHYGAKLVEHFGANSLDGAPLRWYQFDAARPMARGYATADGLVTVSENDLRWARAHGYQPEGRALAIENPLPDALLGAPLALARPPLILYCGSWLPNKGTAIMSADLPRVLREFPQARLRLIGVGAAFRAEAAFPADVCARIEVVPFIADRAALQRARAECSIAIVPSVYESFGLATSEAMASGCAVVATRTGFAADLRDGIEACLMQSPRSPHLHEALSTLLRDDALRERIAREGYRRVQSLRWAPAVARLAATYEAWLADLRGRRT